MKKYLITENFKYKGNIHCHTTLSDGRLTPEDIVSAYKKHGYSFLALTDHDDYIEHNEINPDDFVVINSYEQDISAKTKESFGAVKCYHLNFYAKTAEHHDLIKPEEPDYDDIKGINKFIADIKSQGFLCSYNHPYWSLQNFDDYKDLEGVDFVEVYNHSCYIADGMHENQINVYDDMLRWGKSNPLYCVMTDDNHNSYAPGEFWSDSFGGWIMANVDTLSYESVLKAMENGEFYASSGPVIKEMYFETDDNTLHIKTEPAKSIAIGTAGRRADRFEKEGELVDEAVFKIKESDCYIRAEVFDADGKRADTIAYYTSDLMK